MTEKIIAVDFDGCLCESAWPEIGEARQSVINDLIREQAEGAKLILWSCREGEQLQAAVMWCLNHGIRFDAVNDNLEENIEHFGNNSRKVYATEYWDDKNVLILNSGVLSVVPAENGGFGYQYHPPKKRLRDKLREIIRIMKPQGERKT